MTLKQLLKFINLQDKRLIQHYGRNLSPKETVLARTVKLGEEVGEVCDQILASSQDQRKTKLKNSSRDKLGGELADVLITVLLIAKSTNVDVEKALAGKIAKINRRYKKL